MAVDATRVAVQPTQTAATVQAKAIAKASSAIIEALARYAQKRSTTIIPALQASLLQEFVDRTPEEISKLIGKEHARERTFLRRQRARMVRDIPKALREASAARRDARIEKILARERHFMKLREQALAARAHSAVESLDLQDASPEGAFWMLSTSVSQHTPGCVAMANRFWPWKVLREVALPPMHGGCPCYLLSLDEAVARGLMRADQLPDEDDAMVRARAAVALEEALYETFGEAAVQEAMLDIEEVRRGEASDRHVPIRRFAKGYERGGQFMPRLGGSAGAAIRKALPKPRRAATGGGRRLGSRKVWMKGQHVNVPEERSFSRKVGDANFTSPPGSTNVYRNGKLVSTPDNPEMHADVTRPRGASKKGKLAKGAGSREVESAQAEKHGTQLRKVERALRTADREVPPVHEGDTAQQAHKALAAAGFKADEANARETAAALLIPYAHPDGHELTVTVDRQTGKVTKAAWKPGAEPSDTTKLRAKAGLDKPKEKAALKVRVPDRPSKDERRARERIAHEATAQGTLGTGDPKWERQVERAHADDADAQWDLVAEMQARGPNSDFAKRMRQEFGSAAVRKWERDSTFANPPTGPDAAPPPRYAIRHVSADDHGPSVGVAAHTGVAGGRGDTERSMGTGHYFTSRPGKGRGKGIDLSGARLMRPRDAAQGRQVAEALGALNGIAESGGDSTEVPDTRTGESRVWSLADVLDSLPESVDRDHAGLMAEHAIQLHRAEGDPDGDVAATHLMRGLGFDGVDNRHIAELDNEWHGSVVFRPLGDENPDVVTASPGQGGAVVRGRRGRWVWVRGRYVHIREDEDWGHTEDGIVFHSPAGGTTIYRRHVGDPIEDAEIVSAPRMRVTHPDMRDPRLAANARNRQNGRNQNGNADVVPPPAPPPPPPAPAPDRTPPPPPEPPPPAPRPEVRGGQRVTGRSYIDGRELTGTVDRVERDSRGNWRIGIWEGPAGGRFEWLTTDGLRTPDDNPPDGTGLHLTPEMRDRLLTTEGRPTMNGSRVVESSVGRVTFNERQTEALNATGLPDGQISVGPLWYRMYPEERARALDQAFGRALAHSIHNDEGARDELSGLWTAGKFTSEDGVHLDRYSAEDALAVAHARMQAEDWREFAAEFPDVARFVATQAEARGHSIRDDVREFLHGPETDNVHEPGHPLSNEARAFASTLVGKTRREAMDALTEAGWVARARDESSVAAVFQKIDSEDRHVQTIGLRSDDSIAGRIVAADGTSYGFDPTTVPPEGDTPERLAYDLRSIDVGSAATRLRQAGYVELQRYYNASAQWAAWARHDSDVAVVLRHDGLRVFDARPTILDAHEHRARMVAYAADSPQLAFPRGTNLEDAMRVLDRTSWGRTTSPQSDDGFMYLDLHRTFDGDNPETARQERWRIKVEASRGDDGTPSAVIVEIGKPGVSGRGLAVDDADAQAAERAHNEALRATAAEQAARVDALAERIRTSVNDNSNPFTRTDRMPDIVKALKKAGYTAKADRAFQTDGWSTTWVNSRTKSRVIVRSMPAPGVTARPNRRPRYEVLDGDGNPENRFHSAQVRRGEGDYGRTRTPEGTMPADRAHFVSDMYGLADELAERYGSTTDLSVVQFARPGARSRFEDDHAGYHRASEGMIVLGKLVGPDLDMVMQARREGRELTEREKHRVWMAYHTSFHELNHAVGVPNSLARHGWSTHGYDAGDGGQAIEETLTEELGRRLAVEQLRRHGHDDVVRWVRDQDLNTRGAYQRHRERFRRVLADMNVPEGELVSTFETWKFRMNHHERRNDMARRMAAAQGITEEQAHARLRATLRATGNQGFQSEASFRPILDIDYGDLPPTPEAPLPTIDEVGYAIGTRVRGVPTASTARSAGLPEGQELEGRVTVKAPQYALDGSTPAGFIYRVDVGDGVTVIMDHDQITWDNARVRPGQDAPPPEPPAPPPPPPAPTVTTVRLSDGGTATVGAMVYGNHSRKLGQVQSIDGAVLTVRREDGTIANFGGDSFSSRVVTNEGAILAHGDAIEVQGSAMTIQSIDWSNPQEPTVTVTSPGGTTMVLNARQVVPAGAGDSRVTLPLTRRDGTADRAVVGTQVRLRDGRSGTLTGATLQEWPMGTPSYTVRVNGQVETFSRTDITGFANELPRPPQWSEGDGDATLADRRALEQRHFDREDASLIANPFGTWLAGRVGDGFGEWATANGINLSLDPTEAARQLYVNSWRSQESYDSIKEARPREHAAIMQLAREAGLPTPNWDLPPTPSPEGVAPGEITDETVARSIYTGRFGGLVAEVGGVTRYGENGIIVSGIVKAPNGAVAGQFNRRITRNPDGSYAVYNALLSISSDYQGTGFASAFNKHCFAVYRAKGVREVAVGANLDVGGYTWAATGFDFNAPREQTPLQKAEYRARAAYGLAVARRSRVSEAEWDSIKDRLWSGPSDGPLRQDHVQHAWELAYIDGRPSGRGRTKNIGQKLLLGQSWSGIRLMNDAEQRPAERQGEAAQGPIPGGRPGEGDAIPPAPACATLMTARNAQRWIRHNIDGMSASFRTGVREVATAMERVHPNVRLRNTPSLTVQPIEDGRTAAEYRVVGVGSQITLDPERALAHREILTAQQYGNALYDTHLSELPNHLIPAMERWVTAVTDTGTVRRIQNSRYLSEEARDRLLSREAIFSRAYAQWLTMKSGSDRMKRQLRREQRRSMISGGLWSDYEFRAVSEAMDELFASIGGER